METSGRNRQSASRSHPVAETQNLVQTTVIFSVASFTAKRIAAFMLPAQGSAQREIEIEGAISSVNGTTIQLFNGLVSVEALGAEIETDDEQFTNVSDIKVGAWVELEAKTTADGRIQATSVEVSDEKEDDSEIGGVIGTVDRAAQVFTIGPITIAWNDSTV